MKIWIIFQRYTTYQRCYYTAGRRATERSSVCFVQCKQESSVHWKKSGRLCKQSLFFHQIFAKRIKWNRCYCYWNAYT